MQCNAMHQIFDISYSTVKTWSKLAPKPDFLAHFDRFFVYAVLHPLSYAPILHQIKGLMKIYN